MARLAGVDVFLHLEEAPTESEPALPDVRHRTALLGESLRQAERQSYRNCGINE